MLSVNIVVFMMHEFVIELFDLRTSFQKMMMKTKCASECDIFASIQVNLIIHTLRHNFFEHK